jgi:hypothetical protein
MGHQVVTSLCLGLENRWHTIVCDNLFSSPSLFHDLMANRFWATGTLRANRLEVPMVIGRHKEESGKRGSLVIKMHRGRQMCVMAWKDNVVVNLLSTKQDAWHPNVNILCKGRGCCFHMVVPSTPMQVEYEKNMRRVDATDHLRSLYSMQLRRHKWYLKVVIFVFDQSLVNMYIMYYQSCAKLGQKPVSHLQFNIAIAKHLIKPQIDLRNKERAHKVRCGAKQAQGPEKLSKRSKCVCCRKKPNTYCQVATTNLCVLSLAIRTGTTGQASFTKRLGAS